MDESGQEVTGVDLGVHVFSKSVPLQVSLQEVLKSAGDFEGKSCLAIGSSNAMLSYQLRRGGGNWQDLVYDEGTAQDIHAVVGEEAHVFDGASLPYRAKSFDLVVVLSGLASQPSDAEFIEMCHKALKPDGRLIVCVPREKNMTLIGPIRSLCGVAVGGYTESRLFSILKNGFDVMHMRSFSRFFVEVVDACVRGLTRRRQDRTQEEQLKLYSVAYVFYWIAYQLDLLIFFTRGHRLIACAKRRGWRSREAPILVDGRSISEAVLRPIAK
jgi:SAM-dependent methyltransferase